jgi:hypothetical protein
MLNSKVPAKEEKTNLKNIIIANLIKKEIKPHFSYFMIKYAIGKLFTILKSSHHKK